METQQQWILYTQDGISSWKDPLCMLHSISYTSHSAWHTEGLWSLFTEKHMSKQVKFSTLRTNKMGQVEAWELWLQAFLSILTNTHQQHETVLPAIWVQFSHFFSNYIFKCFPAVSQNSLLKFFFFSKFCSDSLKSWVWSRSLKSPLTKHSPED